MKIAISGGTGFLGQHLVPMVEAANVLTRNTGKADQLFAKEQFASTKVKTFQWDSGHEPAPTEALTDVDAVVHLSGESVQGRWTDEKKKRIRESRVKGTRNLIEGLKRMTDRPQVLISGSAVGFYGDVGDEFFDESQPAGDDFLAEVSKQWEAEANHATETGMRVVNLRTGIVLGTDGGALDAMLTPFKLCLGGKLGDGSQWFPWIHIDDICRLILFAIETSTVNGPVNGTAPNPVRNSDFTKALATKLSRPAFIPVPEFLLKIVLGEFATELLSSRGATPKKSLDAGFEFSFPNLQGALDDLLSPR